MINFLFRKFRFLLIPYTGTHLFYTFSCVFFLSSLGEHVPSSFRVGELPVCCEAQAAARHSTSSLMKLRKGAEEDGQELLRTLSQGAGSLSPVNRNQPQALRPHPETRPSHNWGLESLDFSWDQQTSKGSTELDLLPSSAPPPHMLGSI